MINYIGQLRLYSLADLVLLLLVAHATVSEFAGALFLHIGFLAYLESRHAHTYRKRVPHLVWIILIILGVIFYGHIFAAAAYIIFSYIYTLKADIKNKHFSKYLGALSPLSPLVRGIQSYFLIAGIAGFSSTLSWTVLILMTIRNFIGDLRDVKKDAGENTRTIAVRLGLKNENRYIHLWAVLATSCIWAMFAVNDPSMPIWVLPVVLLIEIISYDLTPRR